MRDWIANWIIGMPVVWWLAERGFRPAHLLPLCIARHVCGIPIRWHHLTGRVGIMDVYPGETKSQVGRQHD